MPQIWHPFPALSCSSSQAEKRRTLLQTYAVDERSAPAVRRRGPGVISHADGGCCGAGCADGWSTWDGRFSLRRLGISWP